MSKLKTGLIALLAVMTTFMIIGVTTVYAYSIEETTMCYGYSETGLAPLGSTEAFLSTNEEAGVWVKINAPPEKVVFKFFYPESGNEYASGYRNVDVVDHGTENWGIAFTTLAISGRTPSTNPGLWTVKAMIDNEIVAVINFNIIDYADLSSQISQITENVQGIVNEKNTILANYEALVEDYDDLVAQYEDLQDSSVSEIQLNNLNRDYEDLQDQYDDLEKAQASTRSMMYASIVVALVAVVVAVYFGVMKK